MRTANPPQEEVRAESHEWALMFMLYKFPAQLYPMTYILIRINFFSIDIHFQSGRLDYKVNKMYFRNILFLLYFHTNWATALCCVWRLVQGRFLLDTPYFPTNIAHGIIPPNSSHEKAIWLRSILILHYPGFYTSYYLITIDRVCVSSMLKQNYVSVTRMQQ